MLNSLAQSILARKGCPKASVLRRIRLVSFDVEGVYSDGLKHFSAEGWTGMTFHTRDSLGLELLVRSGYEVAFVTTARSEIITERARTLGVKHVHVGIRDKGSVLADLRNRLGVDRDEALHVGDDLWDLPAFSVVEVKVAVGDAVEEVKRNSTWVTSAMGGRGAVREVADALLRASSVDTAKLALGS